MEAGVTEGRTDFPPVDVAVIGAGFAGLSAAIYARLEGLSVRVFEKHSIPGGLCTSWKRKGFVFDYCVDWFLGTDKRQGFYDLWKTMGIIDAVDFLPIESFGRYEDGEGRVFELWTDPDRLRSSCPAASVNDRGMIGEFCAAVKKARGVTATGSMAGGPREVKKFFGSLPSFFSLRKWMDISVGEWAARFDDPLLREAFPVLVGATDLPMSAPLIAFGAISSGMAAYPLGGSLPLAIAAERRAKELGADFEYCAPAGKIMVRDGNAVGVELVDGRIQGAGSVIAACDARSVFDVFLEGKVQNPVYEKMFKESPVFDPIVQVSLGVAMKDPWRLDSLPKRVSFPAGRGVRIGAVRYDRVNVYNYAMDPGMAPPGKTVLVVQYPADFLWWKSLRAGGEAVYQEEKRAVLEETIIALEGRFPGIRQAVEASDVATPLTCERYTVNWRGSTQGWKMTKEQMKRVISGPRLRKSFPEIRGLRIAGHWTEPGGGLPPSVRSGRDAVLAIKAGKKRRSLCIGKSV